jgi:hypothetical protein
MGIGENPYVILSTPHSWPHGRGRIFVPLFLPEIVYRDIVQNICRTFSILCSFSVEIIQQKTYGVITGMAFKQNVAIKVF